MECFVTKGLIVLTMLSLFIVSFISIIFPESCRIVSMLCHVAVLKLDLVERRSRGLINIFSV